MATPRLSQGVPKNTLSWKKKLYIIIKKNYLFTIKKKKNRNTLKKTRNSCKLFVSSSSKWICVNSNLENLRSDMNLHEFAWFLVVIGINIWISFFIRLCNLSSLRNTQEKISGVATNSYNSNNLQVQETCEKFKVPEFNC